MTTETAATMDRFIVLRDDNTISITGDRKRAEQIARHFKRLQPTSKIVVEDRATNARDEL
jgi:hypothetical protein